MTSSFRAGAARSNITPPVGTPQGGYANRERCSETVDDELFGKALVLDDGQTKVALVAADLISLPREFVERLRRLVEAQTGIPSRNVLACASHTHFGPAMERSGYLPEALKASFDDAYVENLVRVLAETVRQAHDRLQSARIGCGAGQAPELIFNRRTKKPDGKVTISFRMPPPEEAARLTFGPTDAQVGVVRVEGMDGRLLAAVINFACHPVCGVDRSYALSADYPAYAARVVEQAEGGVCLFALGCAGNIVPIERENRARQWIGTALGAEALKVLQRVRTTDRAPLRVIDEAVELPMAALPTVDEAQRKLEQASRRVAEWHAKPGSTEDLRNPQGDLMLARHLLRLTTEAAGKTTLTTEIQAIRIGKMVLLGLPGEVFVETGLAIKEAAAKTVGADDVFVFSLCNDKLDYAPISAAYDDGGYEAEWTKLGRGAAEKLLQFSLTLLRKISQP